MNIDPKSQFLSLTRLPCLLKLKWMKYKGQQQKMFRRNIVQDWNVNNNIYPNFLLGNGKTREEKERKKEGEKMEKKKEKNRQIVRLRQIKKRKERNTWMHFSTNIIKWNGKHENRQNIWKRGEGGGMRDVWKYTTIAREWFRKQER